ncbi:MAG: DUF445 domain-containing protein [bacterium]|nr:DUF445 domain-containing protein [bacterium]
MAYILNASFITNFISLIFIVIGIYSPIYGDEIYNIGIFAFSGAITNWLAIYMLFEKVPGLYGSGVIPARFEEFKLGIRTLIMNQFFTPENIEKFIKDVAAPGSDINWEKIIEIIDYHRIFSGLVTVVKESPLGGMLMMFGGEAVLSNMEGSFTEKMKHVVAEMVQTPEFREKFSQLTVGGSHSDALIHKIDVIVSNRLDELTPKMVKDIVQEMIRKHLGWLVVWGGVFGGLIGLVSALNWKSLV